jgi:hypothetical protein
VSTQTISPSVSPNPRKKKRLSSAEKEAACIARAEALRARRATREENRMAEAVATHQRILLRRGLSQERKAAKRDAHFAAKRERVLKSRLNQTIGVVDRDYDEPSFRYQEPPKALRERFPNVSDEGWRKIYLLDTGYCPVALQTQLPSVTEWAELFALGYPKESITSSLGIPRVTPDRRKAVPVHYESNADDEGLFVGKAGYSKIAQPDHPYLPTAASRYTFEAGGYSKRQIEAALRRMRCPQSTKDDLRLRLTRGWTTKQLMKKHRIRKEKFAAYSNHLRTYAKRLKQQIRRIFGDSRMK